MAIDLYKEFGITTRPLSEGYVCSLESRAASGGLGLQTASSSDENDSKCCAPQGLGPNSSPDRACNYN